MTGVIQVHPSWWNKKIKEVVSLSVDTAVIRLSIVVVMHMFLLTGEYNMEVGTEAQPFIWGFWLLVCM